MSEKEGKTLFNPPVAAECAALAQAASELKAAANAPIKLDEDCQDWDGHLLQCCGNGNPQGVSACLAATFCTPCAMINNLKAAVDNHAVPLLFWMVTFAMSSVTMLLISICVMPSSCDTSPAPYNFLMKPNNPTEPYLGSFITDPEQQTFLAGATYDLPTKLDDSKYGRLLAEGTLSAEESLGAEEALAAEKALTAQDTSVAEDFLDPEHIKSKQAQAKLAEAVFAEMDPSTIPFGLGRKLSRKLLHKHRNEIDPAWIKFIYTGDDGKLSHKHRAEIDPARIKFMYKGYDKTNEEGEPLTNAEKAAHINSVLEELEASEKKDGSNDKPLNTPSLDASHTDAEEMCQMFRDFQFCMTVAFVITMAGAMLVSVQWRTELRKQFGIRGSPTKDFLAYIFCMPCAICQETRTIARELY